MKAGNMVKSGCHVLGRDFYGIQCKIEDKIMQKHSQAKIKRMILT